MMKPMIKTHVIGRRQALRELDKMLENEDNLDKLAVAFQKQFDRDPFKFFNKFVVPLLPDVEDIRGEGGAGLTHLTPDQVVLEMDLKTCTFNKTGERSEIGRPRLKLKEVQAG